MRTVSPRTGWAYLAKRLGWSLNVPAQEHPESNQREAEAFEKEVLQNGYRRLYLSILEPL